MSRWPPEIDLAISPQSGLHFACILFAFGLHFVWIQSAWLDTAVQCSCDSYQSLHTYIQRSLASSRASGRAIQALEHQDIYFAYFQVHSI